MHLKAGGGLSIYKGGSHTYSGRTPGKQREGFWEMEACATCKGFLQEAALILPLSWASSSIGFHLSSCGFSSISRPLAVSSCFWPVSPAAIFPSFLLHASLAGSVGDPWIVPDPAHQIGWREGKVPLSLLPPPRSNKPAAGRCLMAPAGFFCI